MATTIPQLSTAPDGPSQTMTKAEFTTASANFLPWLSDTFHPELVSMIAATNTVTGEAISAQAVCLAASNFQGDWANLAGAASVPYSVYHDTTPGEPRYWMLLSDLADVTTKTPGTDPEWAEIVQNTNYNGGADSVADTGNVTLTSSMDRLQYRSQSTSGKFYTLPAGSAFNEGTNAATFHNKGDYRFGVKDTDGNFICSVAPDKSAVIDLIDNTAGAEVWRSRDGADLLMTWLKTAVNSDDSMKMRSCKLTNTEIFVAYQGGVDEGFCAVLTWEAGTPAITISNILEFDTTQAGHISCCRLSDTVACICYQGADSDGYAAAVTYNGTDTLTLTDTFEFKDADTITYTSCITIHTSKVGVMYEDVNNDLKAQVLDWDGANITSDTAETNILTGTVEHIETALLAGAVDSATIIVSFLDVASSDVTTVRNISWNGTVLSTSASDVLSATTAGATNSPIVALDSEYFVVFYKESRTTHTEQVTAALYSWSGSAFARKKNVQLRVGGFWDHVGSAFLIDSDHVGLYSITDQYGTTDGAIYKIKAVGASSNGDCELSVISEISVANYSADYPNFIGFDSQNALRIYDDDLNSGYLTAEKVEIG